MNYAGSSAVPGERESQLSRIAYVLMLGVFNLFVVVSWLPRLTTFGDSPVGISTVLLMVMCALLLVSSRRGRVDPHAAKLRFIILAALGFVFFWGYLGIYGLESPFRAGRLMLSLGQGFVVIIVVTLILSAQAIRVSLAICGAMLAISAALAFYNYLGGAPRELTYIEAVYDRSSGFFKNPNQFGIVAAMTFPFAIALLLQPMQRVIGVLVLAGAMACLLLAASKTNLLLAVLLMLGTLCYMLVVNGRAQVTLIAIPLAISAVIAGGMPLLETVNPRAASILLAELNDGGNSESTVDQRLRLWAYSVEVLKTRPLFGEGTGQEISAGVYEHSHSHNVFADLARTTGLPGLLGTIAFVAFIAWAALHTLIRIAEIPPHLGRDMPDRALLVGASIAALSYILSNQMSDSLGPSTSVFLWLSVAIVLRRQELLRIEQPRKSQA